MPREVHRSFARGGIEFGLLKGNGDNDTVLLYGLLWFHRRPQFRQALVSLRLLAGHGTDRRFKNSHFMQVRTGITGPRGYRGCSLLLACRAEVRRGGSFPVNPR